MKKSIKSLATTLAWHLTKFNNSRYPTFHSALSIAYASVKANRYLNNSKSEMVQVLLKKGLDKKTAKKISDFLKYDNMATGEKLANLIGGDLLQSLVNNGIFCQRGRELRNPMESANNWYYTKVWGINLSI